MRGLELQLLGAFLGGLGLFLLGMRLMTDGLKLAAGEALRRILATGTRTLPRGIASGFLITGIVQASGAVTVATIGFVNAGLMDLFQSIGVIYGANIGTTMTGWLVATIGFNVDVKKLALPLIGLGALLRLTAGGGRRGPLGDALAGFGLFFLGIEVLRGSFHEIGAQVSLTLLPSEGIGGALLFTGIGLLLTFLMQSSSAAMALTLAAAASRLIPLEAAAAAVIGANVGTTTTAILSVIGATPNAKRVAAAHVAFNVITAVAAFALLPLLLNAIAGGGMALGMEQSPAVVLALFHTAFNVLGVVLMYPLTPYLTRYLQGRFRSLEEDENRPRYLDRNVVGTPDLAMNALAMELSRIGALSRQMAMGALSRESGPGHQLAQERQVVGSLVEAVGLFSVEMQRAHLPREFDESLPNALRVSRYFSSVVGLAESVAKQQAAVTPLDEGELAAAVSGFKSRAVHLLGGLDAHRSGYDPEESSGALEGLEAGYQELKGKLLRAGTDGRMRPRQMVAYLDFLSAIRRMLEQAVKGANLLFTLHALSLQGKIDPQAQGQGQVQTAT